MRIAFTKMQGCGNDYVYIDGAKNPIPEEQKPEIVRFLSDRHFGIGGDGVIFINPTDKADFEMQMFNADGTGSEMCGNGIRCVAKFVYDHRMTDKTDISVISAGKIKYLQLTCEDGPVKKVRVNMGEPVFEAEQIPVKAGENNQATGPVIDEPITAAGMDCLMTCVSMGNPHAVIYVDETDGMDLEAIGPSFENHEKFPRRTNTEFVRVLDRKTVKMRVWERGTGETLACGTGACAVAVAGILKGLTENAVTVKLLGGDLTIEWAGMGHPVYMTGPAETVFEGTIEI